MFETAARRHLTYIVVDGVDARLTRTAITAHGAPIRHARRRRRVRNQVPGARTVVALKRVVQSKPVAHLVRRRVTQVVVGEAAAGQRRRHDGAPVVQEPFGRRAGGVGVGEVAVPKGVVVEPRHKVQVERLVVALAQLSLHGELGVGGVGGPGPVDSAVGALEDEGDVVRGEGRVEDAELVGEHFVLVHWVLVDGTSCFLSCLAQVSPVSHSTFILVLSFPTDPPKETWRAYLHTVTTRQSVVSPV